MATSSTVQFGFEDCHIFPVTAITDSTVTYGTGFKQPGAVKLNTKSKVETTKFYADNRVYYLAMDNTGMEGDLEVAQFTDQFKTDILANKKTGGVIFSQADVPTVPFALIGKSKTDLYGRYVCLYYCFAEEIPVDSETTKGKTEPKTETASLTVLPLPIAAHKGLLKSVTAQDATEAQVTAFVTTPVIPTETTSTP